MREVYMTDRYYVVETDFGYVVCDANRALPLPFNFFSRHNAQRTCDKYNKMGHRAVAEDYYTYKVAGTRDIEPFRKPGKNPYEEWMKEHGDMFK